MKRFVSLILSVCFLFSINTVSYADYYHKEKNFHLQFQESQNQIQNMTTHF